MSIKLDFIPLTLNFKFPAGTSRGVITQKISWYLKVYHPDEKYEFGIGEVAPLERLSTDWNIDMVQELERLADGLKKTVLPTSKNEVFDLVNKLVSASLPSIKFGLETALLDLVNGGKKEIFRNDFYHTQQRIIINGLVWMGDRSFMKRQIDEKINTGYKCIKIKIGAIDFEQEVDLVKYIRSKYSKEELTIRVDANGAFPTQKALQKLKRLEEFELHSIEQPIMQRQRMSMQLLCIKSGIPIALDEELIGVNGTDNKIELLDDIRPQYIVLKPNLLGGFRETAEWIELAEERNIGWWVTSALESNIGLNAICQFTANYNTCLHQGLGTGMLFENNIDSPLTIEKESIFYDKKRAWEVPVF